jgi:hypothetical protein
MHFGICRGHVLGLAARIWASIAGKTMGYYAEAIIKFTSLVQFHFFDHIPSVFLETSKSPE